MDILDCLQWFFTWFRSLYADGAGLIERIFKVWLMEFLFFSFFFIILAGLPWSREVESLEILYGLESIRILDATQSWKNLHKLHWRSSCCTCLQDLNLWYNSSWVFFFLPQIILYSSIVKMGTQVLKNFWIQESSKLGISLLVFISSC